MNVIPYTSIWAELGLVFTGTSHDMEIVQQIELTIDGVMISDPTMVSVGNVYVPQTDWLIAQSVLLSHVVDDILDSYPEHHTVRSALERTIEPLQRFPWSTTLINDIFDRSIELLLSCFPHGQSEQLYRVLERQQNTIAADHRNTYQRSWLKLIAAGLTQTIEDWAIAHTASKEVAADHQGRYAHILVQLVVYEQSEEFARWVSTLPYEIVVASVSALQEMFLVHDRATIDWRLNEAWNFILGMVLYRYNRATEIALNNLVFYGKPADDTAYIDALDCALSYASQFGLQEERTARYKRLQRIWRALEGKNSPHALVDWGNDPIITYLKNYIQTLSK